MAPTHCGLRTLIVKKLSQLQLLEREWEESVKEWPLTAKLGRKKQELAAAEAKMDQLIAKHGSLQSQGDLHAVERGICLNL